MILAEAGADAASAAAQQAAAKTGVRWSIARIQHDETPGDAVPPGLELVRLELLYVDCLRTLVAVLLFKGDLCAFAQRTVTVAGNPGEMDEQVTPTPVRRDEAEALFVREPLDRAGAHR